MEETVWRTTKPEKKRNGGYGKKPKKQLRSLGVSEKDIEKLRVHDWAIFNSDRRYYQRMQETGTYLEEVAADMTQPEINTVEDFLDNIENQQLYQVLIKVDRLTLHIAFMKVQGYSTREIASYLRITEKAVYRRLDRLKEKIQKIFE
ncbi:MAG: ECF-type sigma factor [Oscillospiraceae bacterium]|nr:MAG: ECF-type sigma factor [Oscillospiraceae bacterium]